MSDYEVKAGLEKLDGFSVVGLSIITDNEKASEEINELWEEFFKQNIGKEIENRINDVIYAVYSDYEGDHTKPYRLTIGYKVNGDEPKIKDHLHHVKVQSADYAMMSAAGEQPKALIETWQTIWQSNLDREFKTDFEVYGKRFFEEGVHEILVAVGVRI